ncbi:uncharacterized protein PHACADRAFT_25916 [Phanerochaete carnosa HHB-10118-sp]|uniref:F-box domain-containing protein n=1 Tax=Phanerochaete carnosa (strain HHB-10118-sp) TaxID=650164 RepID=K5W7E9_PHACS|nr:uncharacterized protein PHACADRAFT_25916 [Phanerochaete carnosa HHB-10118-sp]EKM59853.1 hypothetical protein PHACADRAFT_25916 [Phanerochaete carnosa HHB-10118-sp]
MSYSQVHLPGEILENIFTFVQQQPQQKHTPQDGKRPLGDLHACSLVSRAWRPFAQAQLFAVVKFFFFEDPPNSRDAGHVEAGWSHGAITLGKLHAFFARSPHLASRVRFLDVKHASSQFFSATYFMHDIKKSQSIDAKSLFTLLKLFPRLHALSLSNVILKDLPALEQRLTIPRLKIAYNLLFCQVIMQDVMGLILLFEKANLLEVFCYPCHPAPSVVSDRTVPKPVEVTSLSLPRRWYPVKLYTTLSHCLAIDGIRDLELSHACLPTLQPLLGQIGQNITSLTVNMSQQRWLPDIRGWRKLRKLMVVFGTTYFHSGDWEWHSERLSEYMKASPSLSANRELRDFTIRFVTDAWGFRDLDSTWSRKFFNTLDEVLVTAISRSSFDYITLEPSSGGGEPIERAVFENFVQLAFPILSQKGMLRTIIRDPFDPLLGVYSSSCDDAHFDHVRNPKDRYLVCCH